MKRTKKEKLVVIDTPEEVVKPKRNTSVRQGNISEKKTKVAEEYPGAFVTI